MKEDFIKANHPNLEDSLKDMLDRSKVLKRGLLENENKKGIMTMQMNVTDK